MSFLVLAFDSSIASGSVLLDCKSIVDSGVATQSGDGYVLDSRMKWLVGAFTQGATITRAQVQTPKFNLTAYQELAPLQTSMPGAGAKPAFLDFTKAGRALNLTETIIAQTINGNASAENERVGLWIADGPIAPVAKEHFTIRFTGSTTLVADAWSTVTMTLDRNLQAGKYDIIGARLKSAGGILFRVAIPGFNFRPGGIASQSDDAIDIDGQRHGGWGVWGTFEQNLLPTFDVLSSSADTSQSGELDLVGPY